MKEILFWLTLIIYVIGCTLWAIWFAKRTPSEFEMYMEHTELDKYVKKDKSIK